MLLIRGGSLAVQLLLTGQSPIGLIGGTSAAYAYLQGNKDVVIISRLQNVMAYTLGAKPEIQKPEDIKGKKLAISRFGSTSDFVAESRFEASGAQKDRRHDVANQYCSVKAWNFAALEASKVSPTTGTSGMCLPRGSFMPPTFAP